MKKMLIVLMLLGVITLEAKPKYRIESWVIGNYRVYSPQQKIWKKVNYIGEIPIKVWVPTDYPFSTKEEAMEIINNWKAEEESKKLFKKSEFFYID